MLNLSTYGGKDPVSFYGLLLLKKSDDCRSALAEIDTQIQSQFARFSRESHTNTLENIAALDISEEMKTRLVSLYRYKSKLIQEAKAEILASGRRRQISECQYCTINSVNTMDHLMPKGGFPEFAVHTHNLFPCCSECNSYKSERWLEGGERQLLNLYLDILPDIQYLFVDISSNESIFDVAFRLENSGEIEAGLFNLIRRHYDNLRLLDRFSRSSNEVITNLRSTLVSLPKSLTLDEASNSIKDAAEQDMQYFGRNHWKSVLKLSLGDNVEFLSACGLS